MFVVSFLVRFVLFCLFYFVFILFFESVRFGSPWIHWSKSIHLS